MFGNVYISEQMYSPMWHFQCQEFDSEEKIQYGFAHVEWNFAVSVGTTSWWECIILPCQVLGGCNQDIQ